MNNLRERSYAKMLIESYDALSKSQAIEFLRQVSSTESKLSLLDAMKDKVTLNSEEINELVPSITSSSFSVANTSSFENLSCLSLFVPQQQHSPHMLTALNNAAQSTRTSSNANKRSSLWRGLFGRHSSKKGTIVAKQSWKTSQQATKKRPISGGDHVKLSSTKIHHDIHIQGDNRKNIEQEIRFLSQGLRYDFKQMKSTPTINPSETKLSPRDNTSSIPFTIHSSFQQDNSLSSLSDPTSMRPHTHEQQQNIQSAHNVEGLPKIKTTTAKLERISFNPDQHKYRIETPNYHSPKHRTAIEMLAKKYASPVNLKNNTGLLWYNADQPPINGASLFSKRLGGYKGNNKLDSSSDSRDTSSSSNSSSNSKSSSSNSSSTSSSQKSTKSNSKSSDSSSKSEQRTIKKTGQFNRNENDRDEVIRVDLHSIASQSSTSTSSGASIQPCYQRSMSRKQSSSISDQDTSSSSTITADDKATCNNNHLHFEPFISGLFSPVNHRTIGKFKVKRQRLESSIFID